VIQYQALQADDYAGKYTFRGGFLENTHASVND
jgi:hypothetical protein